MTEMRERIARAICASAPNCAFHRIGDNDGGKNCPVGWGKSGAENCAAPAAMLEIHHGGSVRAALKAMLEPTDDMVEAGTGAIYDQSGDTRADEVWQAMIQAALGENTDG